MRQWHNQIDPEYGESVADAIDDEVAARMAELHLTTTDLTSWRPRPHPRTKGTNTMSTLLRDVITIPQRVGADDYVLRLTDSTAMTRT